MADANTDPNLFVKAMAFTKNAHRDVYPAVDPKQPNLSQAGKVIVITGATRGLGRVRANRAKPRCERIKGK
jgi:hypothetical protein